MSFGRLISSVFILPCLASTALSAQEARSTHFFGVARGHEPQHISRVIAPSFPHFKAKLVTLPLAVADYAQLYDFYQTLKEYDGFTADLGKQDILFAYGYGRGAAALLAGLNTPYLHHIAALVIDTPTYLPDIAPDAHIKDLPILFLVNTAVADACLPQIESYAQTLSKLGASHFAVIPYLPEERSIVHATVRLFYEMAYENRTIIPEKITRKPIPDSKDSVDQAMTTLQTLREYVQNYLPGFGLGALATWLWGRQAPVVSQILSAGSQPDLPQEAAFDPLATAQSPASEPAVSQSLPAAAPSEEPAPQPSRLSEEDVPGNIPQPQYPERERYVPTREELEREIQKRFSRKSYAPFYVPTGASFGDALILPVLPEPVSSGASTSGVVQAELPLSAQEPIPVTVSIATTQSQAEESTLGEQAQAEQQASVDSRQDIISYLNNYLTRELPEKTKQAEVEVAHESTVEGKLRKREALYNKLKSEVMAAITFRLLTVAGLQPRDSKVALLFMSSMPKTINSLLDRVALVLDTLDKAKLSEMPDWQKLQQEVDALTIPDVAPATDFEQALRRMPQELGRYYAEELTQKISTKRENLKAKAEQQQAFQQISQQLSPAIREFELALARENLSPDEMAERRRAFYSKLKR